MSELEYQVILRAIEQTCDAHKEGIKSILLNQEANAIVFGKDLFDIKDHLKILNGTVASLQRESDNRAKVVEEFRQHQKFGKWVHKNWWAVLIGFVMFVLFVIGLYEVIGLSGIIELIK
jgi:hypothetical protein